MLITVVVFSAIGVFVFYKRRSKTNEQSYQRVSAHSSTVSVAQVDPVQATAEMAGQCISAQTSTIPQTPEESYVPYFIVSSPAIEVPEAVYASEVPEATVLKASK